MGILKAACLQLVQWSLVGVCSHSYRLAIGDEAELLKRDRSLCLVDMKLLRVFSMLALVVILSTSGPFQMRSLYALIFYHIFLFFRIALISLSNLLLISCFSLSAMNSVTGFGIHVYLLKVRY